MTDTPPSRRDRPDHAWTAARLAALRPGCEDDQVAAVQALLADGSARSVHEMLRHLAWLSPAARRALGEGLARRTDESWRRLLRGDALDLARCVVADVPFVVASIEEVLSADEAPGDLRVAATRALGHRHHVEAVAPLTRALHAVEAEVRLAADSALRMNALPAWRAVPDTARRRDP